MSDHGEEFGDHGSMEGHGWTLYDEILHVPLILRLPGGARAGSIVEAPVELIDIAPTILEAVGIATPEAFMGNSLLGVIDGSAASSRAALVSSENSHFNIVKRSVRGLRYKLIRTEDTGRNSFGTPIQAGSEFYDLDRDPGERINRYDSESPVVQFLEEKLEEFIGTARSAETARDGEEVELSREDIELLRSLGYIR
jgi:arylsulfatase A-like enzyme